MLILIDCQEFVGGMADLGKSGPIGMWQMFCFAGWVFPGLCFCSAVFSLAVFVFPALVCSRLGFLVVGLFPGAVFVPTVFLFRSVGR